MGEEGGGRWGAVVAGRGGGKRKTAAAGPEGAEVAIEGGEEAFGEGGEVLVEKEVDSSVCGWTKASVSRPA